MSGRPMMQNSQMRNSSMPQVRQPMNPRAPQQQQRPVARPSQSAPRPQRQDVPQVMQSITPAQLANVVGDTEAQCLTQGKQQYVLQEEILILETPVKFLSMYKSSKPVAITTFPQTTYVTQPMSSVHLNSCAQQNNCAQNVPLQNNMQVPSGSCATGNCNIGPYAPPL